MRRSFIVAAALAVSSCGPSVSRTPEGLLVLEGDYPETFNANDARGQLVVKDGCVGFTQSGVGEFQPIFASGSSMKLLRRELGDISKPVAVSVGGFDPNSSLARSIAETDAARRCPGKPFVHSGIVLASKIAPPPAPNPAQP